LARRGHALGRIQPILRRIDLGHLALAPRRALKALGLAGQSVELLEERINLGRLLSGHLLLVVLVEDGLRTAIDLGGLVVFRLDLCL
jgi:hypothetical protein